VLISEPKAHCSPRCTRLVRVYSVLASRAATWKVINGMKKNNDDRRDAKYHDEAHRFVRILPGFRDHGAWLLHGRQPERDAGQYGKDAEVSRRSCKPDTAQFFPIMVYPGTTAYEEAKKRDYIQIEDWGAWLTKDGLHNSVVTLPNITHEQLVSFCDRARRSFLSQSFLSFLQNLKQSLKDRRELQRNLKGFVTLSKYLLRGSQHQKTESSKQSQPGHRAITTTPSPQGGD